MSTRGLALTACLLTLLLAGGVLVGLDRLGHLRDLSRPDFVFENHLLRLGLGGRWIFRPVEAGVRQERYTLWAMVTEPESEDAFSALPYALFRVETREESEDRFYLQPGQAKHLLYQQMGALTDKEWLEEIRLIKERTLEGGERLLLRAVFGHESGATVAYFFDPDHPVPGVGWFRQEVYGEGKPLQLAFSSPGGEIELPKSSK